MLAASGYTKLMSYLVENIDRNSDEVQVDSLLDSVKKLLNQNRDMHQMEYDKWGEQAEILRNYITCLEAKKWQICKYMMERLQFYIRQDFLTKEYDAFCIYLNGIHWPLQSVDNPVC